MPLLTLPSSPAKGQSYSISLSKADLFALAAVTADSYFATQANVQTCVVEFNSSPGNQKVVLSFNLSQAEPSAGFVTSLRARSSFLLERVILQDFDGGSLVIERSQLPSGLDITLA